MAKLTVIMQFETTPDYDDAVIEDKKLRLRGIEQPTAADRLGHEIGRVVRGLGKVNPDTVEVLVAKTESLTPAREDSDNVPTPINDTPSEKRKTG